MPVFSLGQSAIFTSEAKIALQIDGFPDFYALLGAPRDASASQLENAITSRAADLLAVSFTRGGKGEMLTLLKRHITDFRPVLLDETARVAYDEQLQRHENRDIYALPFEGWKQTLATQNRLSRGLKNASRGLKAHLKSVIWDVEYL